MKISECLLNAPHLCVKRESVIVAMDLRTAMPPIG